MSEQDINVGRRRFLTAATSVIGGIGVACVAVPFISSWKPSARAEAAGAPVQADISKLTVGQQLTVEWRGKPVWIINRSTAMLDELPKLDPQLRDPYSDVPQQPEYAKNEYRSRKPEIFVAVGLCTHLGCVPTYRPEVGSVNDTWPGGFFCPCHGSSFDLAGRVFKDVPAPTNLEIPPYQYLSDTLILIGDDKEKTA
ncbi:MAG: ubiquinol-cytochrome c reductase iron-sulfur subunit [Legionellales bacterium]|jgi:ubiquinol-cytochrome c reductase iron-sulfur subunit